MFTVENLAVRLGDKNILQNVHFTIDTPGQLVGILGANGSGKTTLLRALAGLQKATTGKIVSDGPVAYLSQRPETDHRFPMCVEEYVLTGTWRRTGDARRLGRDEFDRALDALSSGVLADAITRGSGRLEATVLTRQYLHLSPLVGTA